MATTTKNGTQVKYVWMVEDVGEGSDKRSFWTKVGVAFVNRDGSLSVQLSAIPMNGRLQIRDPAEKREHDDNRDAA